MSWIDNGLVLQGERVTLRPLAPEHIECLIATGMDKRIWEFLPVVPEEAVLRAYYMEAFELKAAGTQFPFIILDKENNIIGTTRFGDIEPEHRKLEIGWTWYKPEL